MPTQILGHSPLVVKDDRRRLVHHEGAGAQVETAALDEGSYLCDVGQ
jgi:hypothetical protein